MTRHRPSGSYGHRIVKERDDEYVISWHYDRYYTGTRGRFPQRRSRDTDLAGARRFAKRWGLEVPR